MPFAIEPGQTIVFVGDSITDCGRRAQAAPLGEGYVRMINDLITARYAELNPRIINAGTGGHTVLDLFNRWSDDVIRHQPDWVSVKVGINDVHRCLRNGPDPVPPQQFAELYDRILDRLRQETSAKLVLVDPFYISTDRSPDSFRALVLEHLPAYLQVVEDMAKRYDARHVRTHQVFQRLLERYPADRFCPEPVHPYPSGHLVIAHEWLRVMGW
jgi:lysophospholipase L1-like esterase